LHAQGKQSYGAWGAAHVKVAAGENATKAAEPHERLSQKIHGDCSLTRVTIRDVLFLF